MLADGKAIPMRRIAWVAVGLALLLVAAGGVWSAPWPRKFVSYYDPALQRSVEVVEGELEVIWAGALPSDPQQALAEAGLPGKVMRVIPQIGLATIKLPEGMGLDEGLRQMQSSPLFAAAGPVRTRKFLRTPNDPLYGEQWHLPQISAPQAWEVYVGGAQAVVAICDSGVQTNHPDLQANLWTNSDEIPGNGKDDDGNGYVDDVHGYDFATNVGDPNPKDDNGDKTIDEIMAHGTHCAGLAAAVGNNGEGVCGVAWQASIMAVRVGGETGIATDDVAAGIVYAADNGGKVISLSLGGLGADPGEAAGVRYAQTKDVLLVAAAGNESMDIDANPMYPCSYPGVVGVASVSKGDVKSDFSNFGSKNVDISAPGGNGYPEVYLTSTLLDMPQFGRTEKYGGPGWLGTSMACPVVSGTAALVRAYNPKLTWQDTAEVLQQSADNIDGVNPSYAGKLGAGRVNVSTGLGMALPFPRISLEEPANLGLTYNSRPEVSGKVVAPFSTASPVNPDSIVLTLDGILVLSSSVGDLASAYDGATGDLRFQFANPLAVGKHTLVLSASNVAGEAGTPATSVFRVALWTLGPGPQLVSVPLALTDPDPRLLLGTGTPKVARWEPAEAGGTSGNYHQYAAGDAWTSSIQPGRGYWFYVGSSGAGMRLDGGPLPLTTFTLAEEYQTAAAPDMRPGWHMIGNPFPFSVGWGNVLVEYQGDKEPVAVAAERGWVKPVLYAWGVAGYTWDVAPQGQLEPLRGYWMRTLVPCRIHVPPLAGGVAGARAGAGRGAEAGWLVRLTVRAGGAADAANLFGVAPSAVAGLDVGDVEKPPAMGVAGAFRLAGLPVDLAQDVRREGTRTTWEFVVRGAPGGATVNVSWGDLRALPREASLRLVDVDGGRSVHMRTNAGYAYESGEGGERHFRIELEPALEGALRVVGLQATAVRGGGTTIAFALSKEARVTVKILTVSGAEVRTVVEGAPMAAGANSVSWDGRDDRGTAVAPGAYLCEVEAVSAEGERTSAFRTLISAP
jgi:subtilisin family serine protease